MHAAPPPKRRYAERQFSKSLPSADARARVWAPAILGGMVGLVWFVWTGMHPVIIPIMAVAAAVIVHLVTGAAGWLFSEGVFGSSGSGTPYKGGYSQAEAHAAQGRYEDAITAYEAIVAEAPSDPEPYLRIARLYCNELSRLDDAAYWFRKVRREASLPSARDLAASRELIELYLGSEDRNRAVPELARIIEKFPDTSERAWAEGLLTELRASSA
ncbi:MAG TPA: tetratricopeptide repeat protein [Gemmatimonadales bacterium]|jgi:hypothetical protein